MRPRATGGADQLRFKWSAYTAAIKKYTSTSSTSSFAASGYAAAQVVLGALAKVSGTATASSVTAALSRTSAMAALARAPAWLASGNAFSASGSLSMPTLWSRRLRRTHRLRRLQR